MYLVLALAALCILTGLSTPQISLFQANPQLKQFVRPAIERAVHELLPPVVERSIKIALTTCEQIIRKVCIIDHGLIWQTYSDLRFQSKYSVILLIRIQVIVFNPTI
jgi:hypothetical protein